MASRTQIIKGNLTMLGNSRAATLNGLGPVVGYDLIEIGDNVVRHVMCSSFLSNFLQRALGHSGGVELELTLPPAKGPVLILSLIAIGLVIALTVIVNGCIGFVFGGLAFLYLFKKYMETTSKAVTVKAVTIDGKRHTD